MKLMQQGKFGCMPGRGRAIQARGLDAKPWESRFVGPCWALLDPKVFKNTCVRPPIRAATAIAYANIRGRGSCGRPPTSDWQPARRSFARPQQLLSLIHISEPTRLGMISYAVFCL